MVSYMKIVFANRGLSCFAKEGIWQMHPSLTNTQKTAGTIFAEKSAAHCRRVNERPSAQTSLTHRIATDKLNCGEGEREGTYRLRNIRLTTKRTYCAIVNGRTAIRTALLKNLTATRTKPTHHRIGHQAVRKKQSSTIHLIHLI